jgi:hypothetical protein
LNYILMASIPTTPSRERYLALATQCEAAAERCGQEARAGHLLQAGLWRKLAAARLSNNLAASGALFRTEANRKKKA